MRAIDRKMIEVEKISRRLGALHRDPLDTITYPQFSELFEALDELWEMRRDYEQTKENNIKRRHDSIKKELRKRY